MRTTGTRDCAVPARALVCSHISDPLYRPTRGKKHGAVRQSGSDARGRRARRTVRLRVASTINLLLLVRRSVVPLPVVECGLPTASPSPPVPVVDVGSSASAPMDVDLEAPPPPPPTAEAVTRRSSSPPAPVVVGTIAARRGQPARVVDAPSGRIIFTGHHPNGVAPYSSSNRRA
uniref:Uncharacterized protein n=1 Tax=Zea mays TaxID=4577 RepID=A0A804M315_MAIZE